MKKMFLLLVLVLVVCSLLATTTEKPISTISLISAIIAIAIILGVIYFIYITINSGNYCSENISFKVGGELELEMKTLVECHVLKFKIEKIIKNRFFILCTIFLKKDNGEMEEVNKIETEGSIKRTVLISLEEPFPISISMKYKENGNLLEISGERKLSYPSMYSPIETGDSVI